MNTLYYRLLKLYPKELRFLFVGAFNTAFGFFLSLGLYYWLIDKTNIIVIGIFANIIAITVSFITNKTLVFRSKGNWLKEYLKCYIVYGAMAIFGIFLLWLLVGHFSLNIVLSQLIILSISIAFSYFGHSKYTYKSDN